MMDNHLNGLQDKWLWISLAIPSFTLCFTMVWILTNVSDGMVEQHPSPQNQWGLTEQNSAHPNFYIFLTSGFFFTIGAGILQTYTLFFLRDVIKLAHPASAIGILAVVVGTTILITLYPAGLLSDHLGRRPLLIVSGTLGSICSLLLCFSQNLTHVILIAILMGISIGVFMSAGRALVTDLASKSRTATHLGIANLVLVGGLAISKLGGIAIDNLNNIQVDLGYYVLLGLSSASFAIGTIFVSTINTKVDANLGSVVHS
jgi:MFS family permease